MQEPLGGESVHALEGAGEVVRIGEAQLSRGLLNEEAVIQEQFGGSVHLQASEQPIRRTVAKTLEEPTKVRHVESARGGDLLDSAHLFKVLLDPSLHPFISSERTRLAGGSAGHGPFRELHQKQRHQRGADLRGKWAVTGTVALKHLKDLPNFTSG